MRTTTNGSNGTNGHNGHAHTTPEVLAALAALTKALTPAPTAAPVQAAPVPKVRRRKAAPVAAPVALPRAAVAADHVCTVATLLEAHIPLASNTVSKRPGAGLIVRAACACGRVWTGEVPAADLEVMAQTGYWEGEG